MNKKSVCVIHHAPSRSNPLRQASLVIIVVTYGVCFQFQMLKNQNGTTANGGVIKADPKVTEGSRACVIM